MSEEHPGVVSFVRRGDRLQGKRERFWDEYADAYLVPVPLDGSVTGLDPEYRFDPEVVFGRRAPLTVEIGSGLGEAIVAAAEAHPERDFLAIEVFKPGLATLFGRIAKAELTNVKAVQANAPELFATALAPASVAEVWTFFPDPWHKKRHHKRRLIQPEFARLVARVLEPGGRWRIATDWPEYAEHIAQVLPEVAEFANPHGGLAPRFEGRVLTSFEAKAERAGRVAHDFELIRR